MDQVDKKTTAPEDADSFDTIIRVDRLVRPVYPKQVWEIVNPELQTCGPAEYDLAKDVEFWLSDQQKGKRRVRGVQIYEHLKKTGDLKYCLGIHDAQEIQGKGFKFFCRFFEGGRAVFFWKSVVSNLYGDLYVPLLYSLDVAIGKTWLSLEEELGSNSLTPRFIKV